MAAGVRAVVCIRLSRIVMLIYFAQKKNSRHIHGKIWSMFGYLLNEFECDYRFDQHARSNLNFASGVSYLLTLNFEVACFEIRCYTHVFEC